MNYKIKQIVIFVTIGLLIQSCKSPETVTPSTSYKRLAVDSSLTANEDLDALITPYRLRINEVLDTPISYAPQNMSKNDGPYNTPLGNLITELIQERLEWLLPREQQAIPDIVLINHGGIRAPISMGAVTQRTAYEVLPFENKLVVVELNSEKLNEMVHFISSGKRMHPYRGLEIIKDTLNNNISYTINGKQPEAGRTYRVATTDYLANSGDNFRFFNDPVSRYDTDYLLRKAIIDYFEAHDTLPVIDDTRFRLIP